MLKEGSRSSPGLRTPVKIQMSYPWHQCRYNSILPKQQNPKYWKRKKDYIEVPKMLPKTLSWISKFFRVWCHIHFFATSAVFICWEFGRPCSSAKSSPLSSHATLKLQRKFYGLPPLYFSIVNPWKNLLSSSLGFCKVVYWYSFLWVPNNFLCIPVT